VVLDPIWRSLGDFHVIFQLASQEAREKGLKTNVAERAQAIASNAAEVLGQPQGFERVEAVRGYLNLYFSTAEYTRRVLDAVLTEAVNLAAAIPKVSA